MSQIERKEISSEYTQALGGRSGTRERLRLRRKLACTAWQGMRLALLAWSLLCLYCALRACLGSREIDLSAVALHVGMGIAAWWLACRTTAVPDFRERRP